jgi:hypothetical protein
MNMKTLKDGRRVIGLTSIICLLLFSSCEKNDDSLTSTETRLVGTWRVDPSVYTWEWVFESDRTGTDFRTLQIPNIYYSFNWRAYNDHIILSNENGDEIARYRIIEIHEDQSGIGTQTYLDVYDYGLEITVNFRKIGE